MSPSVNIDGTDITGVTIDGQEVQEITIDGQTVFTSTTIVDDFEDQNLNEYSGNLGFFGFSTDSAEGSFSLTSATNNEAIRSFPGDGLDAYPTRGDTVSWYHKVTDGGSNRSRVSLFGYWFSAPSDNNNNYYIQIDDGNNTDLVEDNASSSEIPPNGTWVKNRVETTSSQIDYTILSEDESNVFATLSATDSSQNSRKIEWSTSQGTSTARRFYDHLIIE